MNKDSLLFLESITVLLSVLLIPSTIFDHDGVLRIIVLAAAALLIAAHAYQVVVRRMRYSASVYHAADHYKKIVMGVKATQNTPPNVKLLKLVVQLTVAYIVVGVATYYIYSGVYYGALLILPALLLRRISLGMATSAAITATHQVRRSGSPAPRLCSINKILDL